MNRTDVYFVSHSFILIPAIQSSEAPDIDVISMTLESFHGLPHS